MLMQLQNGMATGWQVMPLLAISMVGTIVEILDYLQCLNSSGINSQSPRLSRGSHLRLELMDLDQIFMDPQSIYFGPLMELTAQMSQLGIYFLKISLEYFLMRLIHLKNKILTIVIPTNAMDSKFLSHNITIHIQLYQMLKCTLHLVS